MIKHTREIIRSAILSPEVVTFVFLVVMKNVFNIYFNTLGNIILEKSAILNISNFPILLFITGGVRFASIILHPAENNNVLYRWPNFWKLKLTTYVGLGFILISIATFYVLFFLKSFFPLDIIAFLFLISILVPLVSNITLFIATVKVRELLEYYSKNITK